MRAAAPTVEAMLPLSRIDAMRPAPSSRTRGACAGTRTAAPPIDGGRPRPSGRGTVVVALGGLLALGPLGPATTPSTARVGRAGAMVTALGPSRRDGAPTARPWLVSRCRTAVGLTVRTARRCLRTSTVARLVTSFMGAPDEATASPGTHGKLPAPSSRGCLAIRPASPTRPVEVDCLVAPRGRGAKGAPTLRITCRATAIGPFTTCLGSNVARCHTSSTWWCMGGLAPGT